MRIYFYLLFSLLLSSCYQLDENISLTLEKIPAFNIQIPEELTVNTEYTISFSYALVDGCHSFYDVEKEVLNNKTLLITTYAQVENTLACTQVHSEQDFTFTFKPVQAQTYYLKFWKGLDSSGNDEYEEFELVIEDR